MKVLKGQPVIMKAEFQGHPSMEFCWLQDEIFVKETTEKSTRKENNWAILDIVRANIDDEAEYTCIARNKLGECKTSAELQVDGKFYLLISQVYQGNKLCYHLPCLSFL